MLPVSYSGLLQPGGDFFFGRDPAGADHLLIDDQAGGGQDGVFHDLAHIGHFFKPCFDLQVFHNFMCQGIQPAAVCSTSSKNFDVDHEIPPFVCIVVGCLFSPASADCELHFGQGQPGVLLCP